MKMNILKIPFSCVLSFSLLIFFYLCNKGNLFLIGLKVETLGSVCTIFLPTAEISNLSYKLLKQVRRKGSLINPKLAALVWRLAVPTLSVKAMHWLH